MRFPPELTWAYLFPADATYHGDQAQLPPPFRSLVEQRGPRGRDVQVVWQAPAGQFPRLDECYGLVAVNCHDASTRDLHAAGFGYVRQFAVVPSLSRPRWFIPLDTPAAAAAAFLLHTPTRAGARAKHTAIRLAARSGLPVWYRDRITIAQRTAPPIEQTFASLLPGTDLRLALSSGNMTVPDPVRKPVLVAVSLRGRVHAFGKIAASGITRPSLQHETEILPALLARFGPDWAGPRLLFGGEIEGHYVIVQTPVRGSPAGPDLTTAHRRFLAGLRGSDTKPATGTRLMRTLRERVGDQPVLRQVLAAAEETLADAAVPQTITHGDFSPSNIRRVKRSIVAIDWEDAELDGLPLIDDVTYVLASETRFCSATGMMDERLVDTIMPGLPGVSRAQGRAFAAVGVLQAIAWRLVGGHTLDSPEVRWLADLAGQLVAPGAALRAGSGGAA